MYTLYESKVIDAFAGDGVETLVCEGGIILAHVCSWKNPQAIEIFKGRLTGKPESVCGKGWRKLTGDEAANAQAWAASVVK